MGIKKVAVIGSGVMGSGIAAHIANAGFSVTLLDIVPDNTENRNQLAENAVARQLKAGGFIHPSAAGLVQTGNLEDHLDLLSNVDWIVEAVIEQLDIKSNLYRRIDKVRQPGSIVSSNTSTIPLEVLIKGQSEAFQQDFLITHFFNPPRHMRLLELVSSKWTRPHAVQQIREFTDIHLGKGIVDCKDTPGFIANRIGIFWMQAGLISAFQHHITVEEADAIMSRPVGIPKTGIFGLWDLVGIDLGPHMINSMTSMLKPSDPFHLLTNTPERVKKMIADGYIGRKGKGGFYRLNKTDGKKQMESLNLTSGEYHPVSGAKLDSLLAARSGLRELVQHDDRGGKYAWDVLSSTLSYAASLIPDICNDINGVDKAMKLGYNWQFGPFELIDQLGAKWFAERLASERRPVPPILNMLGSQNFYQVNNASRQQFGIDGQYHKIIPAEGVLSLADIKLRSEPVIHNSSASLWDLGDHIACLEFHTKMNAMDAGIFQMISQSIELVAKDFSALVLYNEGKAFSAGANLGQFKNLYEQEDWQALSDFIQLGQQTYQSLQQSPFPVIGAPSGLALGGGCEILLHCDALQVHIETYAGLVEMGVGVIPGWGGCKEMLKRWSQRCDNNSEQAAMKAFQLIATSQISSSAAEARDMGILSQNDKITMNKDRLLSDAKAMAVTLAENYQVPVDADIPLAENATREQMMAQIDDLIAAGKASAYDREIATELATIFTIEETQTCSTATLLKREQKVFETLIHKPATQDRINHMLKTGKVLRN